MHFKDKNGNLHFLSEDDIKNGGISFLPNGCVEISDEDASLIVNELSKPTAESVRNERDRLLTLCDWTQVADAPVDQEAWRSYRQALRDITSQEGFPGDVDWPVAP